MASKRVGDVSGGTASQSGEVSGITVGDMSSLTQVK